MGHDWRDRPCLLPSLETRAPRKWNINQPTTKHRQTVRTPRDETIWTNHKFSLMSEWQRSELADRFLLIGRTVAHYSQTEIQHLLYLYFFQDIDLSTPVLEEGSCRIFKRLQMLLLWTSRQNMRMRYSFWRLWLQYTCIAVSLNLQRIRAEKTRWPKQLCWL